MSSAEIHRLRPYIPAQIRCTSDGIVLLYYVYDPIAETMKRCRMKLNRQLKPLRTKSAKMREAVAIAHDLNVRLAEGWTPLHETDDGRLYTPVAALRDSFLAAKQREGLRDTTLRDYKSVTGLFLSWCEDTGRAKKYSGTFLRVDAVSYMDYIMGKGNSNRSYNNTLKIMSLFFQWSLEHCYCKENPFVGIRLLPKQKKRRILIDPASRQMIAEYFARTCPQMLLLCRLIYSSAVRPLEASKIRVADIDLERRFIRIPDTSAKNHKERFATLTQDEIGQLRLLLDARPAPSWFLFGPGKQILPGEKRVSHDYFRKKWDRMKHDIGLPDEMQMYSLRDTGLTDLLHAGVDQLTVQHHADHSSLAIQNIYTDHFDPGLNEKIYTMAPKF